MILGQNHWSRGGQCQAQAPFFGDSDPVFFGREARSGFSGTGTGTEYRYPVPRGARGLVPRVPGIWCDFPGYPAPGTRVAGMLWPGGQRYDRLGPEEGSDPSRRSLDHTECRAAFRLTWSSVEGGYGFLVEVPFVLIQREPVPSSCTWYRVCTGYLHFREGLVCSDT